MHILVFMWLISDPSFPNNDSLVRSAVMCEERTPEDDLCMSAPSETRVLAVSRVLAIEV